MDDAAGHQDRVLVGDDVVVVEVALMYFILTFGFQADGFTLPLIRGMTQEMSEWFRCTQPKTMT